MEKPFRNALSSSECQTFTARLRGGREEGCQIRMNLSDLVLGAAPDAPDPPNTSYRPPEAPQPGGGSEPNTTSLLVADHMFKANRERSVAS